MRLITIDFETYYDSNYSLSKLTTEQYIRSPEFEVIGVSIKDGDKPAEWYPQPDVEDVLAAIPWGRVALLAHNTAFDAAILNWVYGHRPKILFDTMSMAKPYNHRVSLEALAAKYKLGEKGTEVVRAIGKRYETFTPQELEAYGQYCCNDVELTYKLFTRLAPKFPYNQLELIDILLRMFTEPVVALDAELLEAHMLNIRRVRNELLEQVRFEGKDLRSNKHFAEILKSYGVEPPTKISKTTGLVTFAFSKTDPDFLALLEHENPRVQLLVSARIQTKSSIEETRAESLLGVAQRGTLPVLLKYYGAHTGRPSGGDRLNLQNLPRKAGHGLRRALMAPGGYVFVVGDSAQIEARLVAYIAGQANLVDAFREGRDIYCEFASRFYGRKITKADGTERFVGKTAVLGLGYGMGWRKLQLTLGLGSGGMKVQIGDAEAKGLVDLYRREYANIPQLWRRCDAALQYITTAQPYEIHPRILVDGEGIHLPNGMRLTYPGLEQDPYNGQFTYRTGGKGKEKVDKIYAGRVTENVIQALANIVVMEQVMAVAKYYKPVFTVHDEGVFLVPECEATKAVDRIKTIMSTPPKWAVDLPISCEVAYAKRYGDAK